MINYSIYPPELIFDGYEDYQPEYQELSLSDGVILKMERVNQEELQIVRIISSNPQDFIREELQPGTIIKSTWKIS
ncbi:MAG: YlzJ-like family protein [Halanaerobiales bacterium]